MEVKHSTGKQNELENDFKENLLKDLFNLRETIVSETGAASSEKASKEKLEYRINIMERSIKRLIDEKIYI